MTSVLEIFKIGLALFFTKITPARLHRRLCRLIYNYNSAQNRGLDWAIDYCPTPETAGLKIFINTKEFVGWNILFLKHYEQNTNLILQQKITKGMCVVEAGAQIGSETLLLAALVGEAGKVYAFEPNPIVMKRLAVNVLLNDFSERVALSDIALGNENNSIPFFLKNEATPNQGLSSKYKFDQDVLEIQVRQQRLDDWAAANEIAKIDFLKMDVQGAEIDILEGGAASILRFKPLIFTEAEDSMQGNSSQSLSALHEKLTALGYQVFLILPDASLEKLSFGNLKGGNWLAVPTTNQQI
jgi:FkbM family methyltransferase